jgi:prevent-host-death family protein
MGSDEYAAGEMSVADLRKHIAAAIAAAADDGRLTFITSRGRRVAVIGPLSPCLRPSPTSSKTCTR